MKFLQWFQEIRFMAEEQGLKEWEQLGGWREYFHKGLTPKEALGKALLKGV